MTRSSIFTVHRYVIPVGVNETVKVYPFGDVHRDAKNCAVDKWHAWLDKVKDEDNAFFLGMGDYNDMLSRSERRSLDVAELHETSQSTFDDLYKQNTSIFAGEISFMKGKLLGLLEGNHHARFMSGITSTQALCDHFKCKYLGAATFVRLTFRHKKRNVSRKIDIFAAHSDSFSRTVGSSITKVEQMMKIADADIYLMAHDHRKSCAMMSRLYLNDGHKALNLENKKIILARTGSFLKGYEPGKESYVVQKLYTPADLGTICISITLRRIQKHTGNRRDVDALELHATL